jgi:hypothetical protein
LSGIWRFLDTEKGPQMEDSKRLLEMMDHDISAWQRESWNLISFISCVV